MLEHELSLLSLCCDIDAEVAPDIEDTVTEVELAADGVCRSELESHCHCGRGIIVLLDLLERLLECAHLIADNAI